MLTTGPPDDSKVWIQYKSHRQVYAYDDIFPLRRCSYGGIVVNCPNNVYKVTAEQYTPHGGVGIWFLPRSTTNKRCAGMKGKFVEGPQEPRIPDLWGPAFGRTMIQSMSCLQRQGMPSLFDGLFEMPNAMRQLVVEGYITQHQLRVEVQCSERTCWLAEIEA